MAVVLFISSWDVCFRGIENVYTSLRCMYYCISHHAFNTVACFSYLRIMLHYKPLLFKHMYHAFIQSESNTGLLSFLSPSPSAAVFR